MTFLVTVSIVIALIAFGLLTLRHTSPTIYLFPYSILTSINTLFIDTSHLSTIMLVLWLVMFIGLTAFCDRNSIRLRELRLVFGQNTTSRGARRWRFAASVVIFSGAIAFWIVQSGVTTFESQKRLYSSGEFYNFANIITGAFITFPIYIFGLKPFNCRVDPSYKVLAVVILFWSFVQGYLSSDRGLFFFTVMFIVLLRTCQQILFYSRIRIALLGVLILLVQIPLLAQISSERSNRGLDGYEILFEQAFSSDGGYGFSVAKDRTVYEFVEQSGPVMDPVFMLGGFYGLVPRVWWPGKPEYTGTGPIAGSLVFRGDAYVSRGAGIPISMPAEFALVLGTYGFWIGMILYLLLAMLSYVVLRRHPLFCVPLTLFVAQLAGGGLPKSMSVLFFNIIGVLFISKLLNFRVVRVRGRVERARAHKTLSLASLVRRPL